MALVAVASTRAAESTTPTGGTTVDAGPRKLIYQDDFDHDLSQWVIEQVPGGTTRLVNGRLEIDDAAGCTVWFKPKLSGPVEIDYEATLIRQGGAHDRVSDLNCFWMAQDPEHPDDLFFNGTRRGGKFKNYDALRLYYVGYGGNDNSTTRFRRYPGDGSRPLPAGMDLSGTNFMNTPNQTSHISVLADGNKIQFRHDGKVVFDFTDPAPFRDGWFGFRTVRNHLGLGHFRVYQLSH